MSLMDSLPQDVRGRYTQNAPLAESSWFHCGGHADVLFKPKDRDDLSYFLQHCPADIPVTVLGVASNVIIRDGGVRGVVIRLGRAFNTLDIDKKTQRVTAGAAVLDYNLAVQTAEAGIRGLEFYSGIPGSVGGAVRMNAGAYGGETKDVLISAEIMDRHGQIQTLTSEALGLSYRRSTLPDGAIVMGSTFQGQKGNPTEALALIEEIKSKRESTQPIREKTGGSTFANPDGHKAWQLIDQAGCRGLTIGGAMMSEKHCNFMINDGTATASDLEDLGEEVRKRVADQTGVMLRWEIRRLGERP